jgi:uncharacterized membrane protein
MSPTQPHYLPVALPVFLFLAGVFLVVVVLIQARVLHYVYTAVGLSSKAALALLLVSLLGSYFNIPIAQMPERELISGQIVSIFGIPYTLPTVVDWPGTIVAINIGGAVIPGLLSLYLLAKNRIWISGAIATVCVGVACYLLARPVPGLGIAIPIVAPPLITAIVALLTTRTKIAAVAYVSGSLGTLIGADLLNLGRIQGLGAPVAAIGGAGTFDGIFLTGIVAVLLASLSKGASDER